MKKVNFLFIAVISLFLFNCENKKSEVSGSADADTTNVEVVEEEGGDNKLSSAEEQEGWKLLFDGTSTTGWKGAYKENFPDTGWVVENGELKVLKSGGAESAHGGDIVTVDEYSNFDLQFDFKLTEGANSGVKYFVVEKGDKPKGSAFGLEFQVLDDANHPDAKMGRDGNRTIGSLYDLIPAASDKVVNPIGEWNHGRVLVQGNHVEHWLNGKKVVEYERGSKEYKDLVAKSKYAAPQYHENGAFGEATQGRILLQDHGDAVTYKNIKIKVLPNS